ncbi:ZmpA/ZmpB/ZmpC family metallo-endopeptidase-related protein [Endozoicomonas sp. ONNA2]|uniref:ZmpA/ZmpB/ZmpC family metallo-endopeptidase-related protein n=1 Tax=Endozoicomonas sp. ONNA2 TaxID=2828741 RepID=UPI0021472726|nr:ZmpA/ZmpB/ZmpC family metallo-endopeptidase-related protein [Endozoicomonas sp. ONNA2]
MIQPSTSPGSITASHSRPATTQSAQPQGRWGQRAVFAESDAVPLLPDNTREANPVNDHSEIKNRQQDRSLQHRKPASTSPGARQLPNAVVSAAPSGLAADTANANRDRWIAVPDAATLGKIGHDPGYPLNGHYRQTGDDIDGSQLGQPIGNDTHPFTGRLRGKKNGTICNLSHCLVQTLGGPGQIDGLNFNGANIRDKGPVAVVACTIADAARVSNISVKNAHVVALGNSAGIVGGDVRGTVFNTTAINCSVATSASGEETGSAGIGAGLLRGNGNVVDTTAVNCHVTATLRDGGAGIGAGTAFGTGTLADTTAVNCTVENSGYYGCAGIGAGRAALFGMVADTTAVNCNVTASGRYGSAGIGVGGGFFSVATVANTTAVNCNVTTSGTGGGAGIGAGMLLTGFDSTKIADTTALNCTVASSGKDASAGIGAGILASKAIVASTTAINCEIDSEYAVASIKGGSDPDICNVRINGHWENNTVPGCQPWLDNLCAGIDPGLLTPDCRPGDYNFTALANNHQCEFYPVAPTTIPTTFSNSSPRALGLNQAAYACIALGGALFVLAGVCLCIYSYCRNRASSAAPTGHSPILAGSTGDNPVNRSPEHSENSLPDFAEDSDDGEWVPLLRLV